MIQETNMKEERFIVIVLSAIVFPVMIVGLISFVKWDITFFDLSLWVAPARLGLIVLIANGIVTGKHYC